MADLIDTNETWGEVRSKINKVALGAASGVVVPAAMPDPSSIYQAIISLKQSGGGDFQLAQGAADASKAYDTSFQQSVRVGVSVGDYAADNLEFVDYTHIISDAARRGEAKFSALLPNNASLADIADTSTFFHNGSVYVDGIEVVVENGRYAWHSDDGPSDRRAVQVFANSSFTHLGNQGAIDYQTSLGGSGNPAGVWAATSAFGCGLHSGQKIVSRNSIWQSPSKAFYWHDNVDYAEDAYIEIDGGAIIATEANGYSIDAKFLGSMRQTRMVVKAGTVIRGPINIDDKAGAASWLNTDPAKQPANRMQGEIILEGTGAGAGVAWTSTQTQCDCLELRSIPVAGSYARGSGATWDLLFGKSPDVRGGSVGYSGRAYSQQAITSDVPAIDAQIKLGTLLGDCTSVNKTLFLAFEGPLTVNVVLDQNYTAMTNAQVVTALNTALNAAGGGGVRAFYVSQPYVERANVRKPDMESIIKNTDSTAILRGQAVAINARFTEGKLSVAGTTAAQFLGIALDDIPVGSFGRIHRPVKGAQISQSHLVLTGTFTPAVGDLLYPSSTAGALTNSGTVALLRCVQAGRTVKPFTIWEFIG